MKGLRLAHADQYKAPLHLGGIAPRVAPHRLGSGPLQVRPAAEPLPLDLLIYKGDTLKVDSVVNIDESNAYFRMIRSSWGKRLREVFDSLPDPTWHGEASEYPLTQAPAAQQAQAMNPLSIVRAPDA